MFTDTHNIDRWTNTHTSVETHVQRKADNRKKQNKMVVRVLVSAISFRQFPRSFCF